MRYLFDVDIERTMQFILESQAKAELRMEKAETRMQKAETRMQKAEIRSERMEKRLDRRMDSISKLIQRGMRMLTQIDARVAELATAQKATERSLKVLIDSLRHGRNGRNGR
jgi:predicted  nucleic acid-binding Zn-ribbon protein